MALLDNETHLIACIHEAAHAVLLRYMGFIVLSVSVVMPGDRFRRTVGNTSYLKHETDDPAAVEALAIGICAGYVAEFIYYGVEEFESEDVLQFCNREGGYEVGYAAYICEHCLEGDGFDRVIIKTIRYLKTPNISTAVTQLSDLLHRAGEVRERQIFQIMHKNNLI